MKTSIIIGGTKGIGLAISKMFIDRGDKTYILSRFNDNPRFNDNLNHLSVDLQNFEEINKVFNKLLKENKSIDYLVFAQKNRAKNKDFNIEFKLTVDSITEIIKITKKHFSNNGSIVVLGSPASQLVMYNQPLYYHMSKTALQSLVKFYAIQLGSLNIRVNSVLPGTVIKQENVNFFKKNVKLTNLLQKITPLGRQGKDEDIAKVVRFLCSNDSSFVTGQSIFVDGGASLVSQESIAISLLGHKHKK